MTAVVAVPEEVARAILDGRAYAGIGDWMGYLSSALDQHLGLQVEISALSLDLKSSERLARGILEAFRREAIGAQALPRATFVAAGSPESTVVPEGESVRSLLPHHDGGRSSFLTPSALHEPHWRGDWRAKVSDPPSHKLYQGFLILDPGAPGAQTAYYPWVRIIAHAYERRVGQAASLPELARWYGANLHGMVAGQGVADAPYVSLIRALGSVDERQSLQPLHAVHEPLVTNILDGTDRPCKCGCRWPAERAWCMGLRETLGMSWRAVRDRWQTLVGGRRRDLVLGHNLIAVHAGFGGSVERRLLPLSIALATPRGDEYERWLARAWEIGLCE